MRLTRPDTSQMSGLTSMSPLFSAARLTETLSGGYFAMLGKLVSDPKGLQMMERWKMINMCYHIIELDNRPELVKTLLVNMDYSLYAFVSACLVWISLTTS